MSTSQVCYGANEVRSTRRFQNADGSISEVSRVEGYTTEVSLVKPDCKPLIVHEDKKIHPNFGTAMSFGHYWAQSQEGQKSIEKAGGNVLFEKHPFFVNGHSVE